MTGWEWFGLFVFVVILMLLFFAAFGGTNITDESVEEYMKRLMNENNNTKGLYGIKTSLSLLKGTNLSKATIRFISRFYRTSKIMGM